MSITVLDPTQKPSGGSGTLAPRLATLNGKTLGLYNNSKPNAEKLLEMMGAELAREFSFKVVRGSYDPCNIVPVEAWNDLAACDAIILANGDCGACSTSGIGNVIAHERRGIPTIIVATTPFAPAVQMTAKLSGMPDAQYAVIEHPLASLGEDELRERALAAVQQFRELVLQQAVMSSAA
jgi:hypothetical protein